MSAFGALLRKESLEVWRTWRRWVLPGATLLFAVASPLTALAMPALLASLATQGVSITVPDPTWRDSYAQWTKNLVQILLLLVVVTSAGTIADERRRGTLLQVVTKPVSRSAVVLAKASVLAGLVSVVASLGAAVVWVGTRLAFGQAPLRPLVRSTAVWLVLALLVLAATLVASAMLESGLAAAAVGVGASFVLMLAGLWGPAARWSPAGLSGLVASDGALAWPVLTGLLLSAALLVAATAAFSRVEL